MTRETQKPLVPAAHAARRLGVDVRTVIGWIRRGHVTVDGQRTRVGVEIHGRYYVWRDVLQRLCGHT